MTFLLFDRVCWAQRWW